MEKLFSGNLGIPARVAGFHQFRVLLRQRALDWHLSKGGLVSVGLQTKQETLTTEGPCSLLFGREAREEQGGLRTWQCTNTLCEVPSPLASAENGLLGLSPWELFFMEDSMTEQLFFYVQIGVILKIGFSLKSLKNILCPLGRKRMKMGKKIQSRMGSSKFPPIQVFEEGGNWWTQLY